MQICRTSLESALSALTGIIGPMVQMLRARAIRKCDVKKMGCGFLSYYFGDMCRNPDCELRLIISACLPCIACGSCAHVHMHGVSLQHVHMHVGPDGQTRMHLCNMCTCMAYMQTNHAGIVHSSL